MICEIKNTPIYFPFDKIQPEQRQYMEGILNSIENPGHTLIEIPPSTGKTDALIACTVSYAIWQKKQNKNRKIIYCLNSKVELDDVYKSIKRQIEYMDQFIETNFTGMCADGDAMRKYKHNETESNQEISHGIYNFCDLKNNKHKNEQINSTMMQSVLEVCDCIIFTSDCLIDIGIYSLISCKLQEDSIVIFDQAQNIDNKCVESMSIQITRRVLEEARSALKIFEDRIKDKSNLYRSERMERVVDECIPYYFNKMKNEEVYESTPGNMRSPMHVIGAIKRFIEFLKTKLKSSHVAIDTVDAFLDKIEDVVCIERKQLRFCSQRLSVLKSQANFNHDKMSSLELVAKVATFLGLHSKEFSVIFEPYDAITHAFNPTFRLSCNDPSVGTKHIFSRFRNVLLTSTALCSTEMYSKLLDFTQLNTIRIGRFHNRNVVTPLIITKGDDQMIIENKPFDSNRFAMDDVLVSDKKKHIDPAIVRNYGILLLNLSKTVPDNILVFFPNSGYLDEILSAWTNTGVIEEITANKAIFTETQNIQETAMAIGKYKEACDSGRGGILLCVARGITSDGIEFAGGYGRCAVVFGVPFLSTNCVILNEKLKFLEESRGINETEFLTFDAMRQTAQSLSQIIRSPFDYGLVVLADTKFTTFDILNLLPKWIQQDVEKGNTGLSIDMAMRAAREFYREMAQPPDQEEYLIHNENESMRS
ncbi:RAD3 XPD subfam [Enterospora canceri]|uniref:DNA 5'-3' helicase n=1 Tax=Enterospora canceri TaxID=1081671 RepID=A0A1Y1S9M1_9MICR|nr:RAD3 XPD subfam [Enterospora canceri]